MATKKTTVELTMVKAAAKNGGDRYANEEKGFGGLYVPQDISRPDGVPPAQGSKIKVTFEI